MENNFFVDGMRWLATKQRESASVEAVYQKGGKSFPIRAVIGRIVQDVIDDRADVGAFNFDFVVETAYLPYLPEPGDRILCDGKEFEVSNQLDGRCFIFVDSTFEVYRIHTQLVQ